MIVPCIDLMGGKVVQLVQGREKALEGPEPQEMLRRFDGFPEIQVIDLDAALGRGENSAIVESLASQAVTRVGGGVRTVDRGRALVELGAAKVIVGTSAFREGRLDTEFLGSLTESIGRQRLLVALDSKGGEVVVRGWTQGTGLQAEALLPALEPFCAGVLCTFVDREGTMQGTDLEWFGRLRQATTMAITAAGGVACLEEIRALQALEIDVAIGMAVYTGKLDLEDLRGT
ncbi:MAG: HisA/HisF-related TIM barrel protein [Fimbriimonadaceae bacterium]|nr:HisA/HisF-related TIM barrel protein [Fimbriimonadaceae bacterium]